MAGLNVPGDDTGSSPQVRGILVRPGKSRRGRGIIPAGAGHFSGGGLDTSH